MLILQTEWYLTGKWYYKNGKPTGHKQFMELIKVNGGLSLYKTTTFNADLGTAVDQYNVYKGEDLYLALDNKSIPNVFNFFNVKWNTNKIHQPHEKDPAILRDFFLQ